MVFQARIQTKVREGGLAQLRWNPTQEQWSPDGGLGVLRQKIFENGNRETCSRGPCETQQNLYLPTVGGTFFPQFTLSNSSSP